jgi:hypothetical protein
MAWSSDAGNCALKDANREVLDRGSLTALLVQRARQASDVRLVIETAAGFSAALAILVLRPPLHVPLAALAFAFGTFGVWGILDRETLGDARSAPRTPVILARKVVAALGVLAAVSGGIGIFFGLLGTWIS